MTFIEFAHQIKNVIETTLNIKDPDFVKKIEFIVQIKQGNKIFDLNHRK